MNTTPPTTLRELVNILNAQEEGAKDLPLHLFCWEHDLSLRIQKVERINQDKGIIIYLEPLEE